jgi:hypothetical protein
VEDLESVLLRLAENDDPIRAWEITRRSYSTVVKAATAQTFQALDDAWQAAFELASALQRDSRGLRPVSSMGVVLDDVNPQVWRGTVHLNLRSESVEDESTFGG